MMPCDSFLFPQIKNTLKSKQFEDVVTTELKVTQQLLEIPRTENKSASSREREAGIRATNQKGSISKWISLPSR
jgi:hypothetical protein